MSQYNIVTCGLVAPEHGIIGYLTGAETFMSLMQHWQDQLSGCLVSVSKAELEFLATGEGEGEGELISRMTDTLVEKLNPYPIPNQYLAPLAEFLKAVSNEYRHWEFEAAIDSGQRHDEYTEGLCIIHHLYKEGMINGEMNLVLVMYFADRLARAIATAVYTCYKEPLTVFMSRHPKDFKHAMLKVSLGTPVSKFAMSLTMEE
ncbi:hypothetical protein PHOBOS_16 [Erwinia phage vB_EamM_Phobos]|uniref:hypothetical protein n=1 Tax=Erwinia phage vB_EamM_Phobos TaxID=1883377 RepID=UPI00081CC6D8|nr:hypothetical protein BIZ79_gp016 [Erwinia phage vB_EamM_Phobos]ANZ50206.1 hypothetical protein PHOBOS_16 [Erwinia phage vB_EamM_Phobos]